MNTPVKHFIKCNTVTITSMNRHFSLWNFNSWSFSVLETGLVVPEVYKENVWGEENVKM
jgi:hypothetical protein